VLILADEPTGQLDQQAGQLVLDVLLAAADELDAALVVATHDPLIARRLTDRWTMRDGRVLTAAGTAVAAAGGP
jgi:putative ABC transport system ATP-binding protein